MTRTHLSPHKRNKRLNFTSPSWNKITLRFLFEVSQERECWWCVSVCVCVCVCVWGIGISSFIFCHDLLLQSFGFQLLTRTQEFIFYCDDYARVIHIKTSLSLVPPSPTHSLSSAKRSGGHLNGNISPSLPNPPPSIHCDFSPRLSPLVSTCLSFTILHFLLYPPLPVTTKDTRAEATALTAKLGGYLLSSA